ncbi:MAG: UDP-N-acetylmuramoyl-tripeptide--D-alanyl-D-alanine ligase [Azospirillaceae bacterium]
MTGDAWTWIAILIAQIAVAGMLAARLPLLTQFFQQEEYDNPRFLAWWRRHGLYDRRFSAVLVVAGVLAAIPALAVGPAALVPAALLAAGAAWVARRDRAFTASGKKRLVVTARVTRILGVAGAIAAIVLLAGAGLAALSPVATLVLDLALVQAAPVVLVVANALLAPVEARIQRGFREEAKALLRDHAPTIVGVTGSFGKTSTKLILGHVLATWKKTLATPGSVNTVMGISRIVRERLTRDHAIFVAEMGAYGRGSIDRLCDLAEPDLGLVTAVGDAHLERFGSIATTFATKFEMVERAVGKGGRALIYRDGIPAEHLDPWTAGEDPAVAKTTVVGRDDGRAPRPAVELVAQETTPDGLRVTVRDRIGADGTPDPEAEGAERALQVPLFGEHQAGNVSMAYAAARMLGMPGDAVAAALRSVPQIPHRLQVVRQGGSVVVDDAYNSNPRGFLGALAVLDVLAEGSAKGRRVLVTPGMVELGDSHDAEHARLGKAAAEKTDVALAVAPERIEAFCAAYAEAGGAARLIRCADEAEARTWLDANLAPGDVVLFENSLPDLYERLPSL